MSALAAEEVKKLSNIALPNNGKISQLRRKATIHCILKPNYSNCTGKCLFDITKDPCETTDISVHHTKVKIITYFNIFNLVSNNR